MKNFLVLFILFINFDLLNAQNIFSNPGFESVTNGYCSGSGGGGYYQIADGWYNAANSTNGNSSSDHVCLTFYADLFNTPQSGSGSMGFASGATPSAFNGRFSEGVTTTLTNSISAGSAINFTINVNPVRKASTISNSYVVNDANIVFGLYFYDVGSVPESTVGIQHLTAIPQHTIPTTSFVLNTWVTYTASFVVPVNASKVAIGFFNPSSNTTFSVRYFNIDNVNMQISNPCISSPATAAASSGGVVTCSSPNVTLSGSGGGTYSWSGPSIVSGGTTANPVVNAGGTYNVIVTAANGCTATANVNVSSDTTPPSPSASAGGNITCSSPNVTLSGSGGGSYSWSGPSIVSGAATANPVVNAGGTYNLTVTGGNGCTAGTSVVVSQNTTPPSPTASSPGPITCSSPNVTLTGGGGGSYSWSGPSIVSGATTANPVVNAGGTYNLTVTGSNGCTAGTSVNVSTDTTPPSPSASASGSITCSSPNITLTGTGGGTYSWSGPSIVSGATTANPVVNAGGTYNLTVTGSNGCTAGTSVNVTQSTALPTASSSPSTTNLNCSTTSTPLNGGASGGTAPYSYSWSPATGLSATNIANPTASPSSTQTYVLTVTDDNGCQGTSNVTINVNNTAPTPSASGGDLNCTNTSIVLSGSGGGTYSWSGPGIVSGGTTANPTINQPGIYNLTVTGGNGCSASAVVSVNQNITVPSIALTTASTLSTTCASPNTNLSATSNANPTTIYTWLTPISTTLTGNPVNVSAAGVYTVYVTNTSNGCNTSTTPTTVQVVADANIPVVTLSANSGTLTCSTTTIGVTASTSSSPVTYNWLPSSGILSGATTASPVFNAAGNYSLTVTNTANSCQSTGAANVVSIIANNTNPTASASSTAAVLNCTITSIGLTGSGGGNYAWTGPGIVSGGTTANPIVNQPGTYSLVVTNPGNNCSSTNAAAVTITQNTTVPSIALGTASTLSTTCANPTATLSATSSSDPSTVYTWLTPSSTTVTGNPLFANAAGIYVVYVTDTNNGCSSTMVANASNTVQIVPDANIPVVTLSSNAVQITCSDPTPNVNATVNVSTVSYNWNPTTGIVSGSNSNNPTFDTPGTYSLVVTNTVNSCANGTGDYVVTVTSNTTAPTISLSGATNTGTLTCSNTNVVVSPTINPSTGLSYTWSPTTGLASNPNQANATFTANGLYQLAVTNTITGCVSIMDPNSSFTVTSNLESPTVTAVPTSSNTIIGCGTNASVTYSASVTSSSSNLGYAWQPSGSSSITSTISTSGTQTLTVTNNDNGCSTSTSFNITSNTNAPTFSAMANQMFPCGGNSATLTASSTNTNVSYAWQEPSLGAISSGANTNNPIINLIGTYTLTVTDNVTGCATNSIVTVTQSSITAAFSANPSIGEVPLVVNFTNQSMGATSTYWVFGDNNTSWSLNPTNTYTATGTYTVTLLSSNGSCFDTASAIIIVNEKEIPLIIPEILTPNGDGKNDLFIITGIDKYPNNTLEIYNRWGSLVYLKKGYNNTFDGTSNQPTMGNGMLPSATYFIVLNLGDGKTPDYKGYLELKY